jgi:hypothetical protein
MQRGAVLSRVREAAAAVTPSLRVVGLVYTGLGGMIALGLVVSVAVVPVAPALQEVAEPARQAVRSLVQPTSDAVTIFFGGAPAIHIETLGAVGSPTVSTSFSGVVRLDVTIEDSPEAAAVDEPIAVVVAPVALHVPSAVEQSPEAEVSDEIVGLEPIEVSAPHPVEPVVVVVPVPTAGLQMASQEAPKALPTLPAPTETPLQMKARLDAENQAAIDAAKAAQMRAKAEADAANNAAIAARKAAATATAAAQNASVSDITAFAASPVATVSATATPAAATKSATTAPTVENNEPATLVARAQSKASANAANQAAIDAAKAAQARAKAEANAANEAAHLAAKNAKSSAKVTPTPTAAVAPPAVAPSTPVGVVTPGEGVATGDNSDNQAHGVSADGVDVQGGEASLENVPVDRAHTPLDAA